MYRNSPAARCAAKDLERNLDQLKATQEERIVARKIFAGLVGDHSGVRPQAARKVAVREVKRARERAASTPADGSERSS